MLVCRCRALTSTLPVFSVSFVNRITKGLQVVLSVSGASLWSFLSHRTHCCMCSSRPPLVLPRGGPPPTSQQPQGNTVMQQTTEKLMAQVTRTHIPRLTRTLIPVPLFILCTFHFNTSTPVESEIVYVLTHTPSPRQLHSVGPLCVCVHPLWSLL